jgi:hypothetical protein
MTGFHGTNTPAADRSAAYVVARIFSAHKRINILGDAKQTACGRRASGSKSWCGSCRTTGKGASIWRRLLARTVAVRAPKVAKQCWTHSSPLGSKGCFDAAIPICGRSGAFGKPYLCEEPYWGISSSSPRSSSWRPRATATTFQNTARFQSRAGVGWAAQMHAVNDPS